LPQLFALRNRLACSLYCQIKLHDILFAVHRLPPSTEEGGESLLD
jgi:hypothetical protein